MKNIIAKQSQPAVKIAVCLSIWMRGSGLDGNAGGKF
jgi:hypothetical protein